MKGKEIINYIHKDIAPNIEQIKEACASPKKRPAPYMRWAAAVLACLVLTGAAYGAGVIINNRFDTGGHLEIVLLDLPEYLARNENANYFAHLIYTNRAMTPNSYGNAYIRVAGNRAEKQRITGLLADTVFNADGSPVDADALVNDTGDLRLYTADGEEIGKIFLIALSHTHEYGDMDIITRAEFEAQWQNTYETAAAALGMDFALPTVPEEFNPPLFQIIENGAWSKIIEVLYENSASQDGWTSEMSLYIENERKEEQRPLPHLFPGAGRVYEVADTTVHKFFSDIQRSLFVWSHDGLVYRLYAPLTLTNDDALDMIRSMVE